MKAKIKKIKTRSGTYAPQDNRWDSLPEWTWKDACIVRIIATGYCKVLDSPEISRVKIEENEIFSGDDYLERTDDYILNNGAGLEEKGFEVEIEELQGGIGYNLYTKRRWLENKPPKRMTRLKIENLCATKEPLYKDERGCSKRWKIT